MDIQFHILHKCLVEQIIRLGFPNSPTMSMKKKLLYTLHVTKQLLILSESLGWQCELARKQVHSQSNSLNLSQINWFKHVINCKPHFLTCRGSVLTLVSSVALSCIPRFRMPKAVLDRFLGQIECVVWSLAKERRTRDATRKIKVISEETVRWEAEAVWGKKMG